MKHGVVDFTAASSGRQIALSSVDWEGKPVESYLMSYMTAAKLRKELDLAMAFALHAAFPKKPAEKAKPLNGKVIDRSGNIFWYVDGRFSRSYGPAIEWHDGGKVWYLNGVRHRSNGPACSFANGKKEWWYLGKEYDTEEAYLARLKEWL